MAIRDHRLFMKHFLKDVGLLKAYLLAAVRDAHESDDLLQEVSSVLWETFERYDESRPFRAWAMGIARLEVLKWRQRRARSREVLSGEALDALADAASGCAGEAEERRLFLHECLETLSGRVREVVRMRYLDALPVARVAERVAHSVGAVEMALVRARRALRECVERKLGRAGGDG